MKIWRATLKLKCEETGYCTKFEVEPLESDYIVKGEQFISTKDYTHPCKVQKEPTKVYSAYTDTVEQGFDHEPTEEEIEKCREVFTSIMKQSFEFGRDTFIKEYNKKIKALEV